MLRTVLMSQAQVYFQSSTLTDFVKQLYFSPHSWSECGTEVHVNVFIILYRCRVSLKIQRWHISNLIVINIVLHKMLLSGR